MNTVRAIVRGAAGMALIALPTFVTGCNYDPNSSPEVLKSRQHVQQVFDDAMTEYRIREREREIQYVENSFGESAVHLFLKCTGDPPSQKSNQQKCQALLAKIQRAHEADAAREVKDKANW